MIKNYNNKKNKEKYKNFNNLHNKFNKSHQSKLNNKGNFTIKSRNRSSSRSARNRIMSEVQPEILP